MVDKEELVALAFRVKNRFGPNAARKIINEIGHAEKLVYVHESLRNDVKQAFLKLLGVVRVANGETIIKLAHRQHQPAFVKLGDHTGGTTLIMQQQLLTHIETVIDRKDAVALATALCEHFNITAAEVRNAN